MNVVIIEDEPLAAEHLGNMLKSLDSEIKVLKILDSVRGSTEAFQSGLNPDLIFMDIHLSDGISFELFQSVHLDTPVIFTTAYDEYALKAFKTNSIDYLLKPIHIPDLKTSLEKFRRIQGKQHQIPPDIIHQYLKQSHTYKTRFMVKTGESIEYVTCEEIACFYSEDKHTLLMTNSKRKFVIDHTLDNLEALLDPAQFFRINRKLICAISSVIKVQPYFNSRLKITMEGINLDDLVVSRERVAAFKEWLDK